MSAASLAARLTNAEDREAYAALVNYVNALPPGDELSRLFEMFGLLGLVGQRLPEAAGELLAELRAQAERSEEYRRQVTALLDRLPADIIHGLDMDAIAAEMAERFRQQIKETGLHEAANLLRNGAREIRTVSSEMASALRPVTNEYKAASAALTTELATLTAAARVVEAHNARLMAKDAEHGWISTALVGAVMLIVGLACGLWLARHGG